MSKASVISLPHSENKFVKVKLKRLEVQAFQAYGIPSQPGRQERHNVTKSLETSAVFKMFRTDLPQLSLKLEKLASENPFGF